MYIAIKSETDSRVLLYPLIRALKSYGTLLVITSNRQLNRLIEDTEEGGFRNIRVIVDETGATDDIYDAYGIASGDYDFVLLDNMGVVEYDICFIVLGISQTEAFQEDVENLMELEEEKTYFVQFGKVAVSREKTERREPRKKGEYDPAEKFQTAGALHSSKNTTKQRTTVAFPTFQQIELLEGEHKFYEVDSSLIQLFFDVFGQEVQVDKNQFRKEVQRKDESSGYLKSRRAGGEE